MSEHEDIQKLLRLKRYEQPPPGYFDRFLTEFQARQREELLRRPLWVIAWERILGGVPAFRLPRLAMAGSFAAVLLAVAIGVATLETDSEPARANGEAAAAGASTGEMASPRVSSAALLTDSSLRGSEVFSNGPSQQGHEPRSTRPPHYVLDTRPVSFETAFSF